MLNICWRREQRRTIFFSTPALTKSSYILFCLPIECISTLASRFRFVYSLGNGDYLHKSRDECVNDIDDLKRATLHTSMSEWLHTHGHRRVAGRKWTRIIVSGYSFFGAPSVSYCWAVYVFTQFKTKKKHTIRIQILGISIRPRQK